MLAVVEKAKQYSALPSTSDAATPRGRKLLTIVYVVDAAAGCVLLGHKARGFGAGKWNGFGGKVDPTDPDAAAGAIRELHEESGLQLRDPRCMHYVGLKFYQYPEDLQAKLFEVRTFVVDSRDVVGEVVESEEMNPIRMTPIDQLPLSAMWADDPFWLPRLLQRVVEALRLRNDATGKDGDDRLASCCLAGYFEFSSYAAVSGEPLVAWGDRNALAEATASIEA